jgi:hypothetical protein
MANNKEFIDYKYTFETLKVLRKCMLITTIGKRSQAIFYTLRERLHEIRKLF